MTRSTRRVAITVTGNTEPPPHKLQPKNESDAKGATLAKRLVSARLERKFLRVKYLPNSNLRSTVASRRTFRAQYTRQPHTMTENGAIIKR
ncbi:hypothetical protein V9T40_005493 [Parthenolecanium corni]|uniref:Uncharacterized protein n=1 Tax=Parthenolecanium corni TaxID=536013 RepID=A0AAN9Y3D2_9HEMI